MTHPRAMVSILRDVYRAGDRPLVENAPTLDAQRGNVSIKLAALFCMPFRIGDVVEPRAVAFPICVVSER